MRHALCPISHHCLCKSGLKKAIEEFAKKGRIEVIGMIPIREEKRMILEYCEKAIEKAEYKKLEDGTWFAEKNIICLSPFSLLLYLF